MASSTRASIKMYYDIASPFSSIAFHTIMRYKKIWPADIELCPIFLGGIMVATNNTPPSKLVARLGYLHLDTHRVADRFGVDVRSPPGHPLNTTSLNQVRFLRAVRDEEGQDVLAECTRLIYHEFYSVQTLYTSDEFWECLIPVLGREKLAKLRALSQTTKYKEGVKTDVLQVIEQYGMFGAPWFVAKRASDRQEEVFFGVDRFEMMCWWLGPEFVWRGPYPDGYDSQPISDPPRVAQARL